MEQTWHLPAQILALLERREISQRELARRCEISAGVVTELVKGQRCTPEVLTLLRAKLAETEAERYQLVCAHLRDEVVRCQADPTHVVIRHVDGADLEKLDLTPEMNAFIGTLAREAEADAGVAKLIETLGDILIERAALKADLEFASNVVKFPGQESTPPQRVAEDQAPYDTRPPKKKTPSPGRPGATPPVPKPPESA